jgi:nitrite reductase/ring-hydroxylating ferredoxin subunit
MFDATSYTAGDAFQAEKRTLFTQGWLPLVHEAQVASPGDYAAQTIGGWPLFAIRGADGDVRAFRNVCRHQQMQVVEKLAGRCDALRCRYHGWTYDLAGRFVEAPAPVAPPDPAGEHNLHGLRTAKLRGILMCTLGAGAPIGSAALDELFDGEDLPHAQALTVDAACNWKAWLESRLTGDTSWLAPLVLAARAGGGVIVEQVVPRTFLRTRVVFHRYGRGDGDAMQTAADAARTAAEALQAERAAGTAALSEEPIARMHAYVQDALAGDPGA